MEKLTVNGKVYDLGVVDVDPKNILPLPGGARNVADFWDRYEKEIDELAESIRKVGIIVPPLLMPAERQGEYYAIYGYMRSKAAIRAGLQRIRAYVVEGLPMEIAKILSFQENYQRKNLTDYEISTFLKKEYDEIRKANPTLTHSQACLTLAEKYKIGGSDRDKKIEAVAKYLEQFEFLEEHKDIISKSNSSLKYLTSADISNIRRFSREFTGVRRGYETDETLKVERAILETLDKHKLEPSKFIKVAEIQVKENQPFDPETIAEITIQKGSEIKKKVDIFISLDEELLNGLKAYWDTVESGTKVYYWGAIVLAALRDFLSKEGYIR